MKTWHNLLIAVLLGVILTLSFAPFSCWVCSFLSLTGLFWLINQKKTNKNNFISFNTGLLYGLGFFASSVSWVFVSIYKYGHTNFFLASLITFGFILVLALFPGFNLYLLNRFKLTKSKIAFAASWSLLEILRSWLLTGFPWMLLGYSQLNLPFKYYASMFGVYGVSFLVLIISSLLGELLINQNLKFKKIIVNLSLISLIFVGGYWVELYIKNNNYNNYKSYKVAILQSNLKPDDKFLLYRVNQVYFDVTKNLIKKNNNIDLIIWPENSLPLEREHYRAAILLNDIDWFAGNNNMGLLLGVPKAHQYRYNYFYNSVLALGAASGNYDKINLVPFGDYVPLENWLRGLINFFNLPMSSFVVGATKQDPILFKNHKLLATVCYDIAYPESIRSRVLNGKPNAIVAVSEDGWFGDSLGPYQHLDIARMRAIETGLYVARATTSGISAVINNYGDIVTKTDMFKNQVLLGEYKVCTDYRATLWVKLGNKVIIIFLILCLVVKYFKT